MPRITAWESSIHTVDPQHASRIRIRRVRIVFLVPPSLGRTLGRNPDRSLQSFSPCYSQSPLCLFFLLQTHATSYSFCKGKSRKTWQKTIPTSPWFKKSIQEPQIWELSRLCPENSMKLQYVHEFGFLSHLWTKSQDRGKSLFITSLELNPNFAIFFWHLSYSTNRISFIVMGLRHCFVCTTLAHIWICGCGCSTVQMLPTLGKISRRIGSEKIDSSSYSSLVGIDGFSV